MPTIALIAHDQKKASMLDFVAAHRALLAQFDLIATGTTGKLIQEQYGLNVMRFLSGPLGGDLQIGARIAQGEILAVIFLRDPMTAQPHEPDIGALSTMRVKPRRSGRGCKRGMIVCLHKTQ